MHESAINTSEGQKLPDVVLPPTLNQDVVLAAKGGGITFAGRLFTLVSRFAIAFILARLMGAGEYGTYNLALSAIGVASGLALFGLDTAMIRYVPVFASRRDEAGLWGALQLGLGGATLLSILISAGLYALAEPIGEQLFHASNLAPLLRLVSLIVPIFTLGSVAASATQGFKKMQYAALSRDVVQPLIRLVLISGFAIIGLNAAGALVIFGLAIATSTIMLLHFLNKLFRLRRPLRAARRDTAEIMRFSISVYLTDLMLLFQENVQTLLLGALNTMISVGRFAVASQLNLIGTMFQSSITIAAKPIIAELYDRGEREQMGRIYQTASKWMFTFNLPLFLILILFPAQMLSIFGRSFVEGSTALVLLTWAKMIDIGTGMGGAIIDMTGYTKLKLVNSIIQLALSLVCSILLVPSWGIVGAATAVLVGIGALNLLRLCEVFVLFRLLPYNASFSKPILAGLAGLLAALATSRLLPPQRSHLYTAINVAVILGVYTGMILLLGLSAEDRAVLERMRRRMLNRLPRR